MRYKRTNWTATYASGVEQPIYSLRVNYPIADKVVSLPDIGRGRPTVTKAETLCDMFNRHPAVAGRAILQVVSRAPILFELTYQSGRMKNLSETYNPADIYTLIWSWLFEIGYHLTPVNVYSNYGRKDKTHALTYELHVIPLPKLHFKPIKVRSHHDAV